MSIQYIDAVVEQVAATDSTIYTAPSTVKSSHVVFANCNNEDATATSLTVNIVKSGGSVAVTNQYISSLTIAAGELNGLNGIINAVLKPGDFISCIAVDAARLNLKLGMKEIS